jgi:inosine-uridine nucleoside N-ribohydrolase
MTNMNPNKSVIIDCDPGIDDAAALFMALASDQLDVVALTTVFGNVGLDQTTINALKILEVSGNDGIPVYKGAGRTFDFKLPLDARHIHGNDGLGDASIPEPSITHKATHAVNATINIAKEYDGEITYIALGRLTNLALALSLDPNLIDLISEVVVMGGAIHQPGNATPVASANLYGDVMAADVVYASGLNIAQIGLDVCNKVEISVLEQEQVWNLGSPVSDFLKKITPFIQSAYGKIGTAKEGAVRYNDMPAVGYAIDDKLFTCERLKIGIETEGKYTRGQTVDGTRRNFIDDANLVNVALEVDDVNLKKLWLKTISSF